jgi:hypothetical protein
MTGLAQAGLFTMAQVWNLPGPARPGYPQRLGRAALFLGVLGVGVLVTMLLTGLSIYGHHALALAVLFEVLAVLFEVLAVAASIGMYVIGFRVLTPKGGPASWCLARSPEASHAVLQASGTYLVHHFLHGDPVYGVSARCSGLVAWICLGAEITVYAAEINAVLASRLWPRGKSSRSPKPTGPAWHFRCCRTSGGTCSMQKCRLMTGQPTPGRPAGRRGRPVRSPRPHNPGRPAALINHPGMHHQHAERPPPIPQEPDQRDAPAHPVTYQGRAAAGPGGPVAGSRNPPARVCDPGTAVLPAHSCAAERGGDWRERPAGCNIKECPRTRAATKNAAG